MSGLALATHIEVDARVRYWEDASVNGGEDTDGNLIPFRSGESWCPKIRLADGLIEDWPAGTVAFVHYKVCDDGDYWLTGQAGRIAKWRGDYVPDEFLCHGEDDDGEENEGFGDYIIFGVGADGKVEGWQSPAVEADEWAEVAT